MNTMRTIEWKKKKRGGVGLYIFVFLRQENNPYSYIRTMTSTRIHTGMNTQLSNVDISEWPSSGMFKS